MDNYLAKIVDEKGKFCLLGKTYDASFIQKPPIPPFAEFYRIPGMSPLE